MESMLGGEIMPSSYVQILFHPEEREGDADRQTQEALTFFKREGSNRSAHKKAAGSTKRYIYREKGKGRWVRGESSFC
jgi:hypothetical protein